MGWAGVGVRDRATDDGERDRDFVKRSKTDEIYEKLLLYDIKLVDRHQDLESVELDPRRFQILTRDFRILKV